MTAGVIRAGDWLVFVFREGLVRAAVCPADAVPPRWQCWRGNPSSDEELRAFLGVLVRDFQRYGRVGPFGRYVDEHLFYDGWETWGGTPAPIAHLLAEEMTAAAETTVGRIVVP